jgi:hypothetical protein
MRRSRPPCLPRPSARKVDLTRTAIITALVAITLAGISASLAIAGSAA